jgi:hypothetical protein
MGIFRLIKNDNLVAGEHVVGRGDEQKVYKPGDYVESDIDLVSAFPNKFEIAPPGAKDSFTERKATRVPITSLPSKRTPRPVGPEESGRTKTEIAEVAEAIETGEHEVEQRADPNPPIEEKPRKVRVVVSPAPIAKTARRGDIAITEDEEEERPVKKGAGGTAPVKGKDTTKETGGTAGSPGTDEEEQPKKKKKKKSKVKVTVPKDDE